MASRVLGRCPARSMLSSRFKPLLSPRPSSTLATRPYSLMEYHHHHLRPQRLWQPSMNRRLSMDYGIAKNMGANRRSSTNHNQPPKSTTTPTTAVGGKEEGEEAPPPRSFRTLMKQYGPVAIGTYLGVYVATLGGLYAAFEYGFTPLDMGHDSGSMLDKVRRRRRTLLDMMI